MKAKILAFLCAFLFAGCAQKSGPVEVRFLWWGADSRHEATIKAIELFKAKYPDISVKAEYGGWTGYNDKLTTQVVGNSAPDLMQVNWNVLYTLGGDKFQDLSKIKELDLSGYDADLLKSTTIDNRLIAVPYGTTGKVFYYNKTTYDKAGVPLPKSFSDLFAAAKVFKQKLGKDYYAMDLDAQGAFYMTLYYLEQKTGKNFIADNKVAYTKEELTDGFNFYLRLANEGVVPTIAVRAAAGFIPLDQHPDWINGKYAGTYEWDSAAAKWQASLAKGQQLFVGEYPKDIGAYPSAFNKISMTLAINAKSKHPKEAAMLLNFLLNDPEAIKVLALSRGIPANGKATALLQDKLSEDISYEGNQKVSAFKGKPISPYFEHAELQALYTQTMEELGFAKITPEDAASRTIEKVNSFLAKNK